MDEIIEIFGKRLKIVTDESDGIVYCYNKCVINNICYNMESCHRICEDAEGKMYRHFELVEIKGEKVMRRIKFRGKNAVTKNWYYGDCVHKLGKTYIVDVSSEYPVAVSEKTLGQFTGLHDKNGKEIYEGDVIKGKYETTHLIQYNEEECSYFAYRLPISEFSAKGHLDQDWINEYSKIVIGNIHDNPELMKGK